MTSYLQSGTDEYVSLSGKESLSRRTDLMPKALTYPLHSPVTFTLAEILLTV